MGSVAWTRRNLDKGVNSKHPESLGLMPKLSTQPPVLFGLWVSLEWQEVLTSLLEWLILLEFLLEWLFVLGSVVEWQAELVSWSSRLRFELQWMVLNVALVIVSMYRSQVGVLSDAASYAPFLVLLLPLLLLLLDKPRLLLMHWLQGFSGQLQ